MHDVAQRLLFLAARRGDTVTEHEAPSDRGYHFTCKATVHGTPVVDSACHPLSLHL